MIKNKKAYFACEINNNSGKNGYLRIDGIDTSKVKENQFSVDIWFYPTTSGSYSLLKQESDDEGVALEFGVKDGKIFIAQKILIEGNYKIKLNSWNHVFVTRNSDVIKVYIQGCPVIIIYNDSIPETVPVFTLLDTCCVVGKGFSGFIRSVRFYNQCISDVDLGRYIYQMSYNKETMPEVLAWVDCNTPMLQGWGDPPVVISTCNDSYMRKVTHAYRPRVEKGDYFISFPGQNNIIKALSGGRFSIYAKFFLESTINNSGGKQIIFATAGSPWETASALAVYLTDIFGKIFLGIKMGEELKGSVEIEENIWTDVIISYDNGSIQYFVNGEKDPVDFQNTFEDNDLFIDRKVYLGGAPGELAMSLKGNLGSVAVFDEALKLDEAQAFHENDPFIFEDHLAALYSFDYGVAAELAEGFEADVSSGNIESGLVLVAQPITATTSIEEYQYRVTKLAPCYKDRFWVKKASLAIMPLLEFLKEAYGLEASEEGIKRSTEYFADKILSNPRLLNFIDKSPSPKEITDTDIQIIVQNLNSELNIGVWMALQLDTALNRKEEITTSNFSLIQSILASRIFANMFFSWDDYASIVCMKNNIYENLLKEISDPRNNKKVSYACKIGSGQKDGCIEISDVGTQNFDERQFSFDIWFYPEDENTSYELLSFSTGYENGNVGYDGQLHKFYYISGDAYQFLSQENYSYEIKPNQWNNLFVCYDYDSMMALFYHQGVFIGGIQIIAPAPFSRGGCYVARNFKGAIRCIRFYNEVISQENISKYMCLTANPEGKYPEILIWVDFGTPEIRNMGTISPRVALEGNIEMTNAVYAACPLSDNDQIVFPVLPITRKNKTFSNQAFSIYLKFYLPESEKEGAQLIAEKRINIEDSYAIKILLEREENEKGEYDLIPKVEILEERIRWENRSGLLHEKEWNELLIVCDKEETSEKKRVKLFVNGQEGEMEEKEEISSGYKQFGGYFTKLAVFNRALSEKDALAFRENEPFIYEDGLYTMISFENGVPVELTSNGLVPKEWFPDVRLIFGTNNWVVSPYQYCNNIKVSSNTNNGKKISWVTLLLTDYYREIYGLTAEERALDIFKWYWGEDFVREEWLQELFEGDSFQTKKVQSVLEKVERDDDVLHSRLLELLCFNKLENLSEAKTPKKMAQIGVSVISGLMPLNKGGVAAYMKRKLEEMKPLMLLSLTFQCHPSNFIKETEGNTCDFYSAVYAQNYRGLICPPEWSGPSQQSLPAVYVADHLGEYVFVNAECVFFNQNKDDQTPRKIYLKGIPVSDSEGPAFFTQLEGETSRSVKPGGSFKLQLKATLRQSHPPCDGIRYSRDTYYWVYKIDDGIEQNTWMDSELLIYTLPTTPALPISLEEEDAMCAPNVDHFAPISNKLDYLQLRDTFQQLPSIAELITYVNSLFNNTNFTYDAASPICFFEGERRPSDLAIRFDMENFAAVEQGLPPPHPDTVHPNLPYTRMLCAGYAFAVAVRASQLGFDEVYTRTITTGRRDESGNIIPLVSVLVDTAGAGHPRQVWSFSGGHVITVVRRDNIEYVFDAVMRLPGEQSSSFIDYPAYLNQFFNLTPEQVVHYDMRVFREERRRILPFGARWNYYQTQL